MSRAGEPDRGWQHGIQVVAMPAEEVERACEEFYEWAGALIEHRKDDPGDDLMSTLIAASHEGDRLDDAECMNLVLNVLVGGVDTTQSQLAHGLRVFAEHPDQWELLADRPELVHVDRMLALDERHVDMPAAIRAGQTDFTAMGMDQAYCGSPAEASAEEGRQTFETLTEMLVELIREVA